MHMKVLKTGTRGIRNIVRIAEKILASSLIRHN